MSEYTHKIGTGHMLSTHIEANKNGRECGAPNEKAIGRNDCS